MRQSEGQPSGTDERALKQETQLQIEAGIAKGIADIEACRVEEMTDATTAERIARFKVRLPR